MEITRSVSSFFFFFSFQVENLRFDGVLGNDHTVALNRITIFLSKLEIGNEKFLVLKFLFLFLEREDNEKFIHFSSRDLECVIIIRFCGTSSRIPLKRD